MAHRLALSLVSMIGLRVVAADLFPNAKCPVMHPTMQPGWYDSAISQPFLETWNNKPAAPFTITDVTDKYKGGIPQNCYDAVVDGYGWATNTAIRAQITMYEAKFADSDQPLTICYAPNSEDTLEAQVTVLSRIPNNVRSVWRVFGLYPNKDNGGGCGCWTGVGAGMRNGVVTFCYGKCSTAPNNFLHEACNGLNAEAPPAADGTAQYWPESQQFSDAYNQDKYQLDGQNAGEYWSTICKAVDYHVNVPGGLQNLVAHGMQLDGVQHQIDEVTRELAGQLRANQTWYKSYSYDPFDIVDKHDGHVVIPQYTVKSYPAPGTRPSYTGSRPPLGAPTSTSSGTSTGGPLGSSTSTSPGNPISTLTSTLKGYLTSRRAGITTTTLKSYSTSQPTYTPSSTLQHYPNGNSTRTTTGKLRGYPTGNSTRTTTGTLKGYPTGNLTASSTAALKTTSTGALAYYSKSTSTATPESYPSGNTTACAHADAALTIRETETITVIMTVYPSPSTASPTTTLATATRHGRSKTKHRHWQYTGTGYRF